MFAPCSLIKYEAQHVREETVVTVYMRNREGYQVIMLRPPITAKATVVLRVYP
jgi:hypothetical protein